jgi:hypothetical protein
MSRLEQPLNYHVLWSTGDLILRAEIDLLLKDKQGNWHAKAFRVDSASDMTTMPAHDAHRLGLPFAAQPGPLKHDRTGLEIRSGYLRCQVVGMDQTEIRLPLLLSRRPEFGAGSDGPTG